jgi:hypothetical protein
MDVARQVFSVLLVFSLLGAVLWLLRRGGRISFQGFTVRGLAAKRALGNSRSMVAVERLALTPQHTLHLVRINGREVLVATHPQGCSVVTPAAERAIGAGA